jgi:hypothetical protein
MSLRCRPWGIDSVECEGLNVIYGGVNVMCFGTLTYAGSW